MIRKILSIILLIRITLAQLQPFEPDISYTGNKDRFNLVEIVNAHNKIFHNTPQSDDEDEGVPSNEDTAAISNKYTDILVIAIKKNNHPQDRLTRRFEGNFAEDDSKNSFEGGTVSDFEENLKKFQVNQSPK